MKKKLIYCFKNDKNLVNFDPSLRYAHFDWSLLWKVCNIWSKKVNRSYLSWHWRVIQNLKKNRLVVWIITWEIWQIFTTALESWDSKWELLRGTFIPSRKCMSLKLTGNYVMMFQWRKAQNLKRNCLVQNWHQECSKCWPEHSKISKKLHFNGLLLTTLYNASA